MLLKHYTRKSSPRTYRGEARALRMLAYMEVNKRNPQGKSINRILELQDELRRALSGGGRGAAKIADKLNREFYKFRMWPEVHVGKAGKGAWWTWASHNPGAQAIHEFIRLKDEGLLPLVRKCRVCSKWYFARQMRGFACSDKCRKEFYTNDAYWKAHRADKLYQARHGEPREEGFSHGKKTK